MKRGLFVMKKSNMEDKYYQLIEKYNVGAPRYTSYPTVPCWDVEKFSVNQWIAALKKTYDSKAVKSGMALYVHLPFCESLCTYCGCNTRITKNHSVESPYIRAILKEWQLYKEKLEFESYPISEIHFGGGTPTFFSAENLKVLVEGLLEGTEKVGNAVFSFEAHPANTTKEHLETLYDLGFRRLSLGIQDFDQEVQRIINRFQTSEDVSRVMQQAREIGYTSINFDLIYGLPKQHMESLMETVDISLSLKPDRISFYSYAHVPWVKPGQRMFTEADLPSAELKLQLYNAAKEKIFAAGFYDVGMDHFALPTDSLYQSKIKKTLHRNFMGYTDRYTPLMIGLGVSSISDAWGAFAQNEKKVEKYYAILDKGELPIIKGHVLTNLDEVIRAYILELMCRGEVRLNNDESLNAYFCSQLTELLEDGLVEINGNLIKATEVGMSFIRNICMAFDLRSKEKMGDRPMYSKAI